MSCTAVGCLAVLIVMLIGIVTTEISKSGKPTSGSSSSASTAQPTPVNTVEVQGVRTSIAEVDKTIADMKGLHVITSMSINNNEFQVNRRLWEVMPLNAKKGFTLTCAQYWKAHGQTGLCTVVDNMTGEKLASHDSWSGVKIGRD